MNASAQSAEILAFSDGAVEGRAPGRPMRV
jgi:hypothetical protein